MEFIRNTISVERLEWKLVDAKLREKRLKFKNKKDRRVNRREHLDLSFY